MMWSDHAAGPDTQPGWHVLWTHSHCEKLLRDHLSSKGYCTFLPEIKTWSTRGGQRGLSRRPMFPGYLFIRHAMDKDSYLEVRKARGVVNILGEGWDRPAVVPDDEIEALRTLAESGLSCLPFPFLKDGMRVRIVRGPLAGLEGILLRRKEEKGLLVVSVDLLRRSVAVEIGCTSVVPSRDR